MDSSNVSFEPMDVDVSSSSAEILAPNIKEDPEHDTVDYDYRQTTTREPVKLQYNSTETKSIKVHQKKSDRKFKIRSLKIMIFAITVVPLALLIYEVEILRCSEKLDLVHLNATLAENLYGQKEAITSIVDMLNMNTTTKILFLSGGTGVGKTFATYIIMETLWNSSNIYHYTMPGFGNTFSSEFMLGLTLCQNSMLIVDDLTPKQINISSLIKQVIEKSEYLGKNLTVILVFNCDNVLDNFNKKCDETFFNNLETSFKDIVGMKRVIRFKPLDNEHLRKCIERELGDRKIDKYQMYDLMKNFDVSLDGCKGVYNKVKLLNTF